MVSLIHLALYFASATFVSATPIPGEIGEGPTEPIRPSKKTGPFPSTKSKFLRYGPEFGVKRKTIADYPKSFDDTEYLGIAGNNVNYRELKTFKCWHTPGNMKNLLTGEKAVYAYGSDVETSNYHGWEGFLSRRTEKEWTLQPGESWQSFQVLACDGRFVGINAATNKDTGVACGRYWIQKGDTGCQEKILTADEGYRIIGLYGDANGVLRTKHQGMRGLGLITIENGH